MRVDGQWYRTIWLSDDGTVRIIDQRQLPHAFVTEDIVTAEQMTVAIKDMHLRGAGLIGCAAAFGVYLAARSAEAAGLCSKNLIEKVNAASEMLIASRPTAVNLRVGAERIRGAVRHKVSSMTEAGESDKDIVRAAVVHARQEAVSVADEDAESCRRIGVAGAPLLREIADKKRAAGKEPVVNVLTHCNAGWLAFADYGSALSPVFEAFDGGVKVHVWVDETRPHNQGASLTAWELASHGVPHTVVADNAGGHMMQRGLVDMVITGADRVTRTGDVCNKIGTYLKALAAKDNGVPFYVALPSTTIDWDMTEGSEIPIEERAGDEVRYAEGLCGDGKRRRVLLTPERSQAGNWAFDVTPRRLVTGLLTERGLADASEEALYALYPGKNT